MCSYHLPATLQLRKCTTHKEAGEIEDEFSMEFTMGETKIEEESTSIYYKRRPEKFRHFSIFHPIFLFGDTCRTCNFITLKIWTREAWSQMGKNWFIGDQNLKNLIYELRFYLRFYFAASSVYRDFARRICILIDELLLRSAADKSFCKRQRRSICRKATPRTQVSLFANCLEFFFNIRENSEFLADEFEGKKCQKEACDIRSPLWMSANEIARDCIPADALC